MRTKYIKPKPSDYINYYRNQIGNGPAFKGPRYQRGSGLGNFFSSIGRFITPFIRPALSVLGKQAWKTGNQFIGDVASGKDAKVSIKSRLKEAGADLLDETSRALRPQGGKGIKRKTKAKKNICPKRQRKVKDIFN